ncbi:MAG: PAS-domain containing protein [Pseudomonadota bacterium]
MNQYSHNFDSSLNQLAPDILHSIIDSTNAGLAIYDVDLNLVYRNDRYVELCNYTEDEAVQGQNLKTLARISMEKSGFERSVINDQIERGLERLRSTSGFKFQFKTQDGSLISVHRHLLENDYVAESVQCLEVGSDFSERNRLEVMVEAARTRMAHAFESMADGFAIFDSEDRLTVYNKKYVDLNSHIADVIAPGMSYEEMLRTGMERNGYETNGLSIEEFITWRLEKHRNPEESYDLLMHDGRWVRVQERRTHDGGIVGTRSDITELKRREAEILRVTNELRRKNLMFDTALNNMTQGLCMFDADQNLIVTNRRYLEMYRFSADVVKPGIKLNEIMEYSVSIGNYTKEDADKAKAERPDHAKLRQRATLKQRLRDGRVIAVMHEPMHNGGSIATYQDITDHERQELELQNYTRKLEESNKGLQDFAYVASHDLQEPLRKIETFGSRLSSLVQSEKPGDTLLFIDRINNAARRMRMLIDDLLDYSLVSAKEASFTRTNLNDVISGVISDLQIQIEETKAQFEIDSLPKIDADPAQMRQLFQNIISNAIKFRDATREPLIKIQNRLLAPDANENFNEICEIKISDNGIGFNEKYKEKIFAIFQRLHGKNEYEGTGIGLASVRKIVVRHGGSIDGLGEEGKGATFVIKIPVIQSEYRGRTEDDGE